MRSREEGDGENEEKEHCWSGEMRHGVKAGDISTLNVTVGEGAVRLREGVCGLTWDMGVKVDQLRLLCYGRREDDWSSSSSLAYMCGDILPLVDESLNLNKATPDRATSTAVHNHSRSPEFSAALVLSTLEGRGGDGVLDCYANLRSGGDYCIPLRQNLLQQRTLCQFVTSDIGYYCNRLLLDDVSYFYLLKCKMKDES
ncbi:hypothetical protein C2S52_013352 [Perilla frutescens var. hirtella]|nr:hypothetical protein C2S52_013352 [Perilla frutescens var. hirtella]